MFCDTSNNDMARGRRRRWRLQLDLLSWLLPLLRRQQEQRRRQRMMLVREKTSTTASRIDGRRPTEDRQTNRKTDRFGQMGGFWKIRLPIHACISGFHQEVTFVSSGNCVVWISCLECTELEMLWFRTAQSIVRKIRISRSHSRGRNRSVDQPLVLVTHHGC